MAAVIFFKILIACLLGPGRPLPSMLPFARHQRGRLKPIRPCRVDETARSSIYMGAGRPEKVRGLAYVNGYPGPASSGAQANAPWPGSPISTHFLLPLTLLSEPRALQPAFLLIQMDDRGFSRFPVPLTPVLRGAPPVPTPPQRHPRRDRALRVSLPACPIRSIRSDATRVARCARESAQTGVMSRTLGELRTKCSGMPGGRRS